MDNRLYSIWLAELFGQGSVLASKIVSEFPNTGEIYKGCLDDIEPNDSFSKEETEKIKKLLRKKSLERAEEILQKCEKLGISVITPEMEEYPAPLKNLRDMPIVLYCRGKLPDCKNNMLTAVVGTRSMTEYGRNIAYSLGVGLAYGGAIVVSGMALGSDSMALIGALEHGGKTIAVLGSGVDVIYPREHREIYNRIISNGAVISEYPPGSPPSGHHFPVRNRIMSGISDATVVVEADAKSGALITAKNAVKQGRKLFAVPGKIGESGAEGTNMLICDGAIPVLTAEDILSEFEFVYKGRINVQVAHSRLHGLDLNTLASNAMYRARIGSGSSTSNFVGKGSYGGRMKDTHGAENNRISGQKLYSSSEKQRAADAVKIEITKHDKKSEFEFKKENYYQRKEKQSVNSDKKVILAKKIDIDMLDENEIKVYNRMKPNVPVLPDELVTSDCPVNIVMGSLTVLEMAGAVESGGGGYFMRVSEDDINDSPND